jgi:hypothetical protein
MKRERRTHFTDAELGQCATVIERLNATDATVGWTALDDADVTANATTLLTIAEAQKTCEQCPGRGNVKRCRLRGYVPKVAWLTCDVEGRARVHLRWGMCELVGGSAHRVWV